MNYTDDEHYYALLMSDDITLGKGEYVRGQNISTEALSYSHKTLVANGCMSLDNDELYLNLIYKLSEKLSLEFIREKQSESAKLKTLDGKICDIEVIEESGFIQSVKITDLDIVLQKDEKTLLLRLL